MVNHAHENVLQSPEIDKEYNKKKGKNKKKVLIAILGTIACVSGLAVGTSLLLTAVGSTVGALVAGCSAFIASVAGSVSNEK